MRGIKGTDDWLLLVGGDLRPQSEGGIGDGNYPGKEQNKVAVFFSGGCGLYHFSQGEWDEAIESWVEELYIVERAEVTEGRRLHKGWFYFMLAKAYHNSGLYEHGQEYMEKAKEEDHISYGDNAVGFPANNTTLQPST